MATRLPAYLFKLIIYTILIGTLPVLVVGAASYSIASKSIQKQVSKANTQLLNETQSRVDQLLRMVDQSVIELVNSTAVPAMSRQLDYRQHEVISDMYASLNRLVTYDLGIQDVTLVSFTHRWVTNNRTGFQHVEDNRLHQLWRPYLDAGEKSYWFLEAAGSKRLEYIYSLAGAAGMHAGKEVVSFAKKIPLHSPAPYGLVIVDMSDRFLDQLLSQQYPEGNVAILDADFRTLTQDARSFPLEEVISVLAADFSASGFFRSESEGEALGVAYTKSSYNGWIYIHAVSIDHITAESKKIGWFMIATLAGVLLAIVLVSVRGSRKLYRPVEALYRGVSASETVGASDEFHAISSYLNELSNTQVLLKKQIQHLSWAKLFAGELSRQEIDDIARNGEIREDWVEMAALAIRIDTISGTSYTKEDADLTKFAISNIAAELIPQERRLGPVMLHRGVALLLGRTESDGPMAQHSSEAAALIQRQVSRYIKLQISVGISRPFRMAREVPAAYAEADEALEYRIRLGGGAILHYSDVRPGKMYKPALSKPHMQDLIQAVKHGNSESARTALHALLSELFQERWSSREYYVPLSRLLLELLELLDAGELEQFKSNGNPVSLIDRLHHIPTAEEMERFFLDEVITPMIEWTRHQRESQFKNISADVRTIVEEQYEKDVTLEYCGSILNYHPDYIRRVFKEETGMTFSEYVSQVRMNKAKEWLTATDMKIADIAERLHYNNAQNFIRYFRKVEGMTPGQYRELKGKSK